MVQMVKLNFVRLHGSIHMLSNSELHPSHYQSYSGILVPILGPKAGCNEQYQCSYSSRDRFRQWLQCLQRVRNHGVNQSILLCLLCTHEKISVCILHNSFIRLPRVISKVPVQVCLVVQNLICLDPMTAPGKLKSAFCSSNKTKHDT